VFQSKKSCPGQTSSFLDQTGCLAQQPNRGTCGPNQVDPAKAHFESSSVATAQIKLIQPRHTSSPTQLPRHYQEKLARKSSAGPLHVLDPNIEITLRRLRKGRNTIVCNSNSSNSDNIVFVTNDFDSSECSSSNINSNCNFGLSNFKEPNPMENNDRTLKELATPDVVYQPWCIQYPQLEPTQSYELESGLIYLLPKFHGPAGEDPHKHLKEFHVVCSTMRPQGIPKDYIKMKAFPFSLDGAAKDWLYL
ncbi:hypothetical protein CR513_50979, partial [Mucuna pruriens]